MHSGPPSLRSVPFAFILAIMAILAMLGEARISAAPGPDQFPIPTDSPDAATVVGPEGGVVASPDGRITLTFPAGALGEKTSVLLAATRPVGRSPTVLEFNFALASPSPGATPKLSVPVSVEIKLTADEVATLGSAISSLSLSKSDPSTGGWLATAEDANIAPDVYRATLSEAGRYALNAPRSATPQAATSLIDPATGGVLESGDAAVRLDFPVKATIGKINAEYKPVQRFAATDFTIVRQFELTAKADLDGSPVTTFDSSLQLTVRHSSQDLAGLSYENLALYWRDEAKGQWVTVPGHINNGGTITAPLTHFSVYATGTSSYIAGPGRILWHQGDQHAGAATYTIPIPLLPGPGGFKPPDLNLTYNSARVDEMKSANSMGSWAGIGWEMDLPTIFRDPTTGRYYLQIDGATDEIIQTGTDTDGSTKWSTRSEQYRRIRSKTVNGQHAVFIVTQKDGMQYRFGTTTDLDTPATTLQRWYWTWDQTNGWKQEFYQIDIGRIIDTRGNYADYTYSQTISSYCPTGANPACQNVVKDSAPWWIYWGANLNADNTHKFRAYIYSFNLGRSDVPTCNVPPVVQTRKLNAVILQVLEGGIYRSSKQWIPSYQVDNGNCSGAGAFKLTSVDVRGTDSSSLRTYAFGYGSGELPVDYKSPSQTCLALTWPYLQSASNGFGATTTFAYQYQWQAGAAGSDPACPGSSTVGTWSRQVLSSRTENPGIGTSMTHTYTYTTGPNYYYPAGVNPIDAEYRGFREVRDTDGLSDYSICTYYTTGWDPEMGMPSDILTGHPFRCEWFEGPYPGTSVKKTDTFWTWRYVTANVNFVYPWYDMTLYGTPYHIVYFQFDIYGNNTFQTEYQTAYQPQRQRRTEFYANTTSWIVGLPASSITYRYDPNTPPYSFPVDKTTYTYDNKPAYTDPPDKGDLTKEARYDEADVAHIRVVYGYDPYGNRTSETRYRDGSPSLQKTITPDPTYHTYVASEVVTSVVPNQTTAYGYDFVLGKRTTTTDPNGQSSNVKYDVHGRVLKEWFAGDSEAYPTTEYVYAWDGAAPNQTTTKRLEQSGTTSVLTSWEWFDGLERTIQRRAEGPDCLQDVGVTDTVYDAVGNVASQSIPYAEPLTPTCSRTVGGYGTDPDKPKTEYLYDVLGRETKMTNPRLIFTPYSIRWTTYTGFTETVIDENDHKTERVKDAFGRVVSVKEYSGNCWPPLCFYGDEQYALYATTAFEYDLLDRQTKVTDNAGNQSISNYNMLGFTTSTVDPDRGTWTYTYYDDGLLKTKNDARTPVAQTITYAYDSLGRITSKAYSGYSIPPTVTYTYDQTPDSYANGIGMPDGYPIGRLTRVVDWAGEHLHSYDARGRETDERHIISGATYDVGRSFDTLDRETCTVYPDGEKVGSTFDGQGVIETLQQYPSTGCTGTPTATYLNSTTYNAASLPTTLAYGNGLNVTFGYRSSDWRLNSITTGSLLNYSYGFDAKGNIESISDSVESTTQNLVYDHRDRLDQVTGLPSATIDYTDNEIGNLTTKQEGPSYYTSMAYPPAGNPRPHAVAQANYAGGYHSFQYDANGNMTGEYDNTGATVHEYAYDAEGMTWIRTSPGQNPSVVYYTYDADGTLSRKAPAGQGAGTVYVAGVYEKDTYTGEVVKYYFAAGQQIAMRKGGTLYYLTQDHLGGTALVTDASSAMVSRVRYFPYGGVRTIEGANPPPTDKLFTGQQRETNNEIYHYKARMYNADIGRMAQSDPLPFTQPNPNELNKYSYANNNPVGFADPTGLQPIPTCYIHPIFTPYNGSRSVKFGTRTDCWLAGAPHAVPLIIPFVFLMDVSSSIAGFPIPLLIDWALDPDGCSFDWTCGIVGYHELLWRHRYWLDAHAVIVFDALTTVSACYRYEYKITRTGGLIDRGFKGVC